MKEELIRILIRFPETLLERIEDFRFENRSVNRTQAILELIEKGLEKEQSE